jgi:hypothetical protein
MATAGRFPPKVIWVPVPKQAHHWPASGPYRAMTVLQCTSNLSTVEPGSVHAQADVTPPQRKIYFSKSCCMCLDDRREPTSSRPAGCALSGSTWSCERAGGLWIAPADQVVFGVVREPHDPPAKT